MKIGRTRRWLRSAPLLVVCACSSTAPPPPLPPIPEDPPPEVAEPVAPLPCERILHVEVSKAERWLRARCASDAVIEMRAALGRNSEGPKRNADDSRTPEGLYRISGPARPSRFHLFLPIDYPSLDDAEAARAEGRISETDYLRIRSAHARGDPPPRDTPLGGDLGFHGEGERWRGDSEHLDWTYGCVGLSDSDIEALANRVEVGTPVLILP
jgi:murein L,D-transpeptidase YafK